MKKGILKRTISFTLSVLLCFSLAGCDVDFQALFDELSPELEEIVTTEIGEEPQDDSTDGKKTGTVIKGENKTEETKNNSKTETASEKTRDDNKNSNPDSDIPVIDDDEEDEIIIENDDDEYIINNDSPELEKVIIMRDWEPYPNGRCAAWDNFNTHLEKVEKRYNVDIVEKKWKTTLEGRTLAGLEPEGHLYLVGNTGGNIYDMAIKKQIAYLDDAMKATGINMTADHYNAYNTQLSNINGKQWAIGIGFARINAAVLFNKNLTEAAGYDILDLVNSNQWTWDKMTEVAKKTTKRSNSGEVTQWGIAIGENGIKGMVLSNGGHIVYPDSKGKFVSCVNNANTVEAITQVYDWYHVDKVANAFNGGQWTSDIKSFVSGKVAMIFADHADVSTAYNNLTGNDYGVAYLPKGPKMKKYVSYMTSEYSYVIPACYQKNTIQLLSLVDQLHDWPVEGYTRDDQFRDEWTRYFYNSKQYNMWYNMHYSDDVVRMWDASDRVDFGNGPFRNIISGTMTPATWANSTDKVFDVYATQAAEKYKYTGSLK